jgi:hypothetical protein
MRQYLVVANQTLDSERLAQKLSTCLAAGPCRWPTSSPRRPPCATPADGRYAVNGARGEVITSSSGGRPSTR